MATRENVRAWQLRVRRRRCWIGREGLGDFLTSKLADQTYEVWSRLAGGGGLPEPGLKRFNVIRAGNQGAEHFGGDEEGDPPAEGAG